MLINANAKESKRGQRNSEGRAFGKKTDTKVFTRAAAAMPAAKKQNLSFSSQKMFPQPKKDQ